jgi:hypothetical protein
MASNLLASRISFLFKSITQLNALTRCIDTNNCDKDKKLEAVRKIEIEKKMKLFNEMRELHPDDLVERQKKITKIQNDFLINVRNWDTINPYTMCVKKHCKEELIAFMKKHIPFFKNQIKINSKLIKKEGLTLEEKMLLERYLKKDQENLERIKNIKNWQEEDFNEQLYRFASVTYPKFLFII